MFAEDVSWVGFTSDVKETDHAGAYGLAYSVERQCVVPLVEFSVRDN